MMAGTLVTKTKGLATKVKVLSFFFIKKLI